MSRCGFDARVHGEKNNNIIKKWNSWTNEHRQNHRGFGIWAFGGRFYTPSNHSEKSKSCRVGCNDTSALRGCGFDRLLKIYFILECIASYACCFLYQENYEMTCVFFKNLE